VADEELHLSVSTDSPARPEVELTRASIAPAASATDRVNPLTCAKTVSLFIFVFLKEACQCLRSPGEEKKMKMKRETSVLLANVSGTLV
jgi:hypothetical protein